MITKNQINFEQQDLKSTAKSLNHLLANFQIYYQNLRGYHWNIKGRNFFELHVKFEEYYTEAAVTIDEIAERILTLGSIPLHSFQGYLNNSEIKAEENKSHGEAIVASLIEQHKTLLTAMRNAVKEAGEIDDEGTIDILTPVIQRLEKHNWMLSSYISK